jgi:hypothetical protein
VYALPLLITFGIFAGTPTNAAQNIPYPSVPSIRDTFAQFRFS